MDQKAQIYELQEMLRTVLMGENQDPVINPDGIYGKETAVAVAQFQNMKNLPCTGKTDRHTWQCLADESRKTKERYHPLAVMLFPSPAYCTETGEKSDTVCFIQLMMGAMKTAISFFEAVTVTGVYDKETEDAVLAFQKLFLLPQTGQMDVVTWNCFAKSYNQIAANPSYTN